MTDQTIPLCPVEEPLCPVIDELVELRQELVGLTELVRTDSLTGLYNFRHFITVLAQEMERTRRTQQSTALIMIDLDFFKRVNDTWGHEAGNTALVSTAKILGKTIRQLDTPCRYGGEEFAIILPSIDLVTALIVAERVREAIDAAPVLVDGKDIGLTASLGVALFEFSQVDTPEQLVERADCCLYKAKEAGRNQVAHEVLELQTELSVSHDEKEALSGLFGDANYDEEI